MAYEGSTTEQLRARRSSIRGKIKRRYAASAAAQTDIMRLEQEERWINDEILKRTGVPPRQGRA